MTGGARSPFQPPFLYRTNGRQSPYTRAVWTLDDAIFEGQGNDCGRRVETAAARVAIAVDCCGARAEHLTDWRALDADRQGTAVRAQGVVVDVVAVVVVVAEGEGVLGVQPRDAGGEALPGAADVDGHTTASPYISPSGSAISSSRAPLGSRK